MTVCVGEKERVRVSIAIQLSGVFLEFDGLVIFLIVNTKNSLIQ